MANFPAFVASKHFHLYLKLNDIIFRTFWYIKKCVALTRLIIYRIVIKSYHGPSFFHGCGLICDQKSPCDNTFSYIFLLISFWNKKQSVKTMLAMNGFRKQIGIFFPNIPTTPITAMGCQQCLPPSVVQLKGKHCWKPHCRNGVVNTFRPYLLTVLSWIPLNELSSLPPQKSRL